jgi:hypothetical protein
VGTIDQRSILHRRRRLRAKTWCRNRHCETHGTVGPWGSRAFLASQRRARADLQRTATCAVRHKRPAGVRREVRLAATRSRSTSVANAARNIESPRLFTRSNPFRVDVLRDRASTSDWQGRHADSAMSAFYTNFSGEPCPLTRAGAISSNAREDISLGLR